MAAAAGGVQSLTQQQQRHQKDSAWEGAGAAPPQRAAASAAVVRPHPAVQVALAVYLQAPLQHSCSRNKGRAVQPMGDETGSKRVAGGHLRGGPSTSTPSQPSNHRRASHRQSLVPGAARGLPLHAARKARSAPAAQVRVTYSPRGGARPQPFTRGRGRERGATRRERGLTDDIPRRAAQRAQRPHRRTPRQELPPLPLACRCSHYLIQGWQAACIAALLVMAGAACDCEAPVA